MCLNWENQKALSKPNEKETKQFWGCWSKPGFINLCEHSALCNTLKKKEANIAVVLAEKGTAVALGFFAGWQENTFQNTYDILHMEK